MRRARASLIQIALIVELIASCALPPDGGPAHAARTPIAPVVAVPPSSLSPPKAAVPRSDVASWYGEWHHGRPTASGEAFDMGRLTAAHRSLPLGSCVEVTRLANGRRVLVRVNDRGPYRLGRTIDLSHRAAQELGMVDDGLARVEIRALQPAACAEAGQAIRS